MSLLSWPTITDDDGSGKTGTKVNNTLVWNPIKDAINALNHSSTNPTLSPAQIIDEIVTARGSLLNLDARLDVLMNENGTLRSQVDLATVTNLQSLVGTHNLHVNGSMFSWPSGSTVGPGFHTLAGAGASIVKTGTGQADTARKIGPYAAKITSAAALAQLYQTYVAPGQSFTDRNYLIGKKVSIGAWVKCGSANVARLNLYDGSVNTYSTYHTGDGQFQFLSATHTVDAAATTLRGGIDVAAGTNNAVVSGLVVFMSNYVPSDWQPEYPGVFGEGEFNVHMQNGRYFAELNPAYFFGHSGCDIGYQTPLYASAISEAVMLAANTVYCLRIMIPYRVKVSTIYGIIGATAAAGKLVGYGIYSSDGAVLILDSGPLSTTSANTVVSKALTTPTSIGPGSFIYAVCCDSGTPTFPSITQGTAAGIAANFNALANAGSDDIVGSAANASVAGQLPATLGTITPLATAVVIPFSKFSG